MSGDYRLFGSESSAYSTKLRSYLKYKGVPFAWTPRTQDTEDELRAAWRFQTLPVLVTASGFPIHDTTPLIEALESDLPEPGATPADPALAYLACVLEEYADSWLAKTVYHYRWTRKKDQRLAAQRAIDEYCTREAPADRKAAEDVAIDAMTAELKRVGLEGEIGSVLEKSFKRFIRLLDQHLQKHLFIFGGHPTIADFAIGGQLIQMMKDPTPAKIIEKEGEFVAKWCEFLSDAKAGGPFESLDDLRETLLPIFRDELAVAFLPWAAENLEACLSNQETFNIAFGKDEMTFTPLKSSARSFRELRRKFVGAQAIDALKAFTDEAASTVFLQRPQALARTSETAPAENVSETAVEETPAAEASEPSEGNGRRRRRRRGRRGNGGAQSGADAAEAGDEGEDFEETEEFASPEAAASASSDAPDQAELASASEPEPAPDAAPEPEQAAESSDAGEAVDRDA